jgi:hypothetical protein
MTAVRLHAVQRAPHQAPPAPGRLRDDHLLFVLRLEHDRLQARGDVDSPPGANGMMYCTGLSGRAQGRACCKRKARQKPIDDFHPGCNPPDKL